MELPFLLDATAQQPIQPQQEAIPTMQERPVTYWPGDAQAQMETILTPAPAPAQPMHAEPEWDLTSFNELEIALLQPWLTKGLHGSKSPFLPPSFQDGLRVQSPILTAQDLLTHACGYNKWLKDEEARKAAANETPEAVNPFAAKWDAYIWECRSRLAEIERTKLEWRAAIEKRKAAIEEWDAYVTRVREVYKAAAAVPAPVRPLPDSCD